jgi:hypothetical protein
MVKEANTRVVMGPMVYTRGNHGLVYEWYGSLLGITGATRLSLRRWLAFERLARGCDWARLASKRDKWDKVEITIRASRELHVQSAYRCLHMVPGDIIAGGTEGNETRRLAMLGQLPRTK